MVIDLKLKGQVRRSSPNVAVVDVAEIIWEIAAITVISGEAVIRSQH